MNRNRLLLGLGGALMGTILLSCYVYRQLQRNGGGKVGKQVPVVVAGGVLKLGQRLTADDLAVLEWPEGRQPAGSFSRPEDCVGRALIVPLVQDEVVLDQELAKPEAGAGLPVSIPQGMRAMSVAVDDVVAVAGFVTPGTTVDVLVTGMGPAGPVTRTILEHLRVLAVGQELQAENGKPQTAPVVTLLVNPDDGEKLALATAEGKIHLALRNTVDVTDANPSPVFGSTLFQGKPPAAAIRRGVVAKAAPAPVPFTVQIIRGDKIEIQTFPDARLKQAAP